MPSSPPRLLLAPALLGLALACEVDKAADLCESSTAILDAAGAPTGFERCADGAMHRAEALATDADHTESACPYTEADADTYEVYCVTDAECVDAAYGACVAKSFGEGPGGCGCSYACTTDADCGADEACVPDGLVEGVLMHSTCAPASCRTDADCPGGECGLSLFNNGCAWGAVLACRSEEDACRTDADCDAPEACALTGGAETWACARPDCVF